MNKPERTDKGRGKPSAKKAGARRLTTRDGTVRRATTVRYTDQQIEAMRQDYLSGDSMRKIAARYGITLRGLAYRSQKGEWQRQREEIAARTCSALARSTDRRVMLERGRWQERVAGTLDTVSEIADRASTMLARHTLEGADFRELATLIKVLVDSMKSLRDIMGDDSEPVLGIDNTIDETRAAEILKNLGMIA